MAARRRPALPSRPRAAPSGPRPGRGIAACATASSTSTYAEPAGVVGIIVPWNSPVALLIRSLAPALSAGNTVAVKMPGQTALVANLVASPDVQVISYTGSTTVGRIVAANGAPTLKRMNLELGGKTPMIVFDDADLDATIPLLAAGIITFGGEFCMTGSRVLVQRGVADTVRTRLAAILGNVRVGDGMDPSTDMGPLIDKADVRRVEGFAEGGYKQSGIGRLRGPLAITEFQGAKTVVHAIPPFPV
jgi:betaine-aldehyde dehydrogenase